MEEKNWTACRRLTSEQLETIFYTRVAACFVTFVACLVSLALICYFVCWRRTWNTFVHRLKLQLTAVALVVSVLYLIQVLPMKLDSSPGDRHIDASKEWSEGCKVVIFLLQYGDWVLMLMILWLVIYLCRLAWKSGQTHTDQSVTYHQKFFEILGTVSAFVIPLLIVWMPFIGGFYGVDDHKWCEFIVRVNCTTRTRSDLEGIGYVVGTWYIPAILVTLASTIGIITALVLVWKHYRRQGLTNQMTQAVLKAIAPITYLILFNLINVIDGTNLIYHSTSDKESLNGSTDYQLWLVHAVTGPGRAMTIPFGFVLSLVVVECCSQMNQKKRDAYNRLN